MTDLPKTWEVAWVLLYVGAGIGVTGDIFGWFWFQFLGDRLWILAGTLCCGWLTLKKMDLI